MKETTKRLFDIVASALGLVLLLPLIILIYLAIRLTCRGPVIFSQARVGRGGKEFVIYKFRTMVVDSEQDGVPQLAAPDDDRLTRVGRFLRRAHLDELPQLWNVLRGDMSLVGYRPERQYFINQIMALRPDYAQLYAMRPGITSKATVYNGYTNNMEKMIRRLDMDLEYLHHHSLATDVVIIFETVASVLGKKP